MKYTLISEANGSGLKKCRRICTNMLLCEKVVHSFVVVLKLSLIMHGIYNREKKSRYCSNDVYSNRLPLHINMKHSDSSHVVKKSSLSHNNVPLHQRNLHQTMG